ncbi:hypothetical protein FB45DRAFT_1029213 [Roridomyces roridus]|uniref:Uncharacterized protein n=1 Tax=Roridomyces roridus TaxID=1738132 RepID=A0AAD7BPY8_9AGAR|nr:hypothetical protein FB45DRAFT_1029213 [Roridomyces roridus]
MARGENSKEHDNDELIFKEAARLLIEFHAEWPDLAPSIDIDLVHERIAKRPETSSTAREFLETLRSSQELPQ